MTSQSRLSPGIEFNEIDRSSYGKRDYSITGTTVFMTGFAQKGEDYTAQWINTMQTFMDLYGVPENEPERYLYNGTKEIIDRGGIAVIAKLPYDNKAKDAFTAVTYQLVDPMKSDSLCRKAKECISDISAVDNSITATLSIGLALNATEKLPLSVLDEFKVSNSLNNDSSNKIKIIDITRGYYDKINFHGTNNNFINSVECLGLMPVITTAMNAMFYQGIISSNTNYDEEKQLEITTNINRYTPIIDACNRLSSDVISALGSPYEYCLLNNYINNNSVIPISSTTIHDQCVAKIAVSQFPSINFMLSSTLDRQYIKHIGLVVFRVFKDKSNDSKINFEPLESFVGSLDRHAKNQQTGASDYIGDIVNTNSKYVNLFANVRINDSYKRAQTIITSGQTAPILGFAECELYKHIDYKNSIVDPLNMIMSKLNDPNQYRIDLVVDAGITNIAAFAAQYTEDKSTQPTWYDMFNSDTYPYHYSHDSAYHYNTLYPWKFDNSREFIQKWFNIIKKFDDFCKYNRKDCMFICDIFRPVVLEGNEKIVRNTNKNNTIANMILPKLKYVAQLNSSYSAGYSNWFYSVDSFSSDFFWCPPSIKAAGVYVYTDAYFHPWDAPAGFNRGIVTSVYDVSFNPINDEAGKLYQQAWNYAISYPVEGITIEGQKTCQLKPTALDRVNVRRLMLWIEKRVIAVARRFLYEGNTLYMRQRFIDTIRPILEEAKTGNGIIDYAIRCDDILNDIQTIENNELKCIIAVRPVKTIEYIKLGFIISNQSADVNEEVMK